jgi:3-hydroxyisobutyrate dehydrogenase-like beta-hydroxyacid dehydrogenase
MFGGVFCTHIQVVGFIGLGNMGAHMARNLLKAGHPLVVHDVNVAVVESFEKLGAKVPIKVCCSLKAAKTPAGVAESASTIITMLPARCRAEVVGLH